MRTLTATQFKPATFLDRLFAFMIDGFIIGVGQTLLRAVLPEALHIFVSIASLSYFLIFQVKMGATPGKKMMGLRLLSADSDEFPSPKAVLLRETIGRFVSLFPMGLGYIWPLFHKQARAFHDLIGATRVIQEKEHATSAVKVLAGGALALTCAAGLCVYTVLYTSIPLQHMAKRLEIAGMKVEGLSGSLARGFTVGMLEFKDDNGTLSLRNLRFKYSLFKLFASDKVVIEQISVDSGLIEVDPRAVGSSVAKRKNAVPAEPEVADAPPAKKTNKIQAVEIQMVDLNQIQLVYGTGKSVKLNRFWLRHLNLTESGISLASLGIDSPTIMASSGGLEISKTGDLKMSHSLQLQLRPGLVPQINKEIVLRILAERSAGEFGKVSASAFSDKVRVWKDKGQYSILVRDFSPSDFFAAKTPVRAMNFKWSGSSPFLAALDGSVQIGARTVPVQGSTVKIVSGGREYEGQLHPMTLGLGLMSGEVKLNFTTAAEPLPNPKDELAQLIYERNYDQLAFEQQAMMESGAVTITSLPGLSLGASPAGAGFLRAPASMDPAARAKMLKDLMDKIKAAEAARGLKQ